MRLIFPIRSSRNIVLSVITAIGLGGCANGQATREDAPAEQPVSEAPAPAAPVGAAPETDATPKLPEAEPSACREPVEVAAAGWLDKGHSSLYQAVCGSVAWFDGFFGTRKYDQASAETFGRVSMSGFWDERNGFEPKVRFRARFALPGLRERTSLLMGRGDDKELVQEREPPPVDAIPGNFNQIEDDSFLIGLGYSRNQGLERGFDFSVGAKLRWLPEPYVKASYRRAWDLDASTLLSVRPLIYWRDEEGFGTTLNFSVDRLLAQRLMLRWGNSANISEDPDVDGVEWVTRLSLFQAFDNRRAITYGVLLHGETLAEVPLRNYGVELRYRQRILRKWLFLELLSSVTWPQEFRIEKRETNIGLGLGIEMYFGPMPDNQMR